uniref:SAYSvFN domain-containing protein n=1 Tax=Acrobeloides nanus TaxID=290746 RepID=A0A914CZ68_9BILA
MKKAEEQLLEYRKKKIPIEKPSENEEKEEEIENPPEPPKPRFSLFDSLAVDVLNIYPMRKWREFCAAHPFQCWVTTFCFWFTGQILMVHAEFGIVYFVISLFILMFLNLGVRKEGEMSAYSVFNPDCERLLGQLTGEHFERDLLLRRARDN